MMTDEQESSEKLSPLAILETCLYVDDLVKAEAFYRDVLGLSFVSHRPNRHLFFRCGNQMLLLFDAEASSDIEGEIPPHGSRGPGHVAFSIEPNQFDPWRQRLEDKGVDIEKIFDWPQGGRSIYFRDPAGNSLELAMPSIWSAEES